MRWSAALGIALNLALVGVTIRVLDRVLAEYRIDDVVRAVSAVPAPALAFGFACSALGYLALVGSDYIAFRFAGRPLPWRTMLVPSFVTFAVSNSAPASIFTAGGARYWLSAGLGLTAAEATVIASVNTATYALGLCTLAGALLLAHPLLAWEGHAWLGLPVQMLGALLLLLVAGYLVTTARWRSPIVLLGHRLRVPSFRVALRQLGVSAADWLLSSAALYVLVASVAHIRYFDFSDDVLRRASGRARPADAGRDRRLRGGAAAAPAHGGIGSPPAGRTPDVPGDVLPAAAARGRWAARRPAGAGRGTTANPGMNAGGRREAMAKKLIGLRAGWPARQTSSASRRRFVGRGHHVERQAAKMPVPLASEPVNGEPL